tara:strand:- start:15112 stop:15909 length:798 start_codon:yes stop_codon:yes gene_type:complete
MAQLFKQKLIKPGREFNYSEGQKVLANAAIKADQIVYIMGSDGPFSKVDVADADAAGRANGRLLIAKHDIPAGGYGICLPWKLVTTVDTSTAAVGDAVYLSQTPGTTVASNLTLTAPTTGVHVIIGRVTVAATVANGGAIMVQAASPESRVEGGSVVAGTVVGRPVEQFRVVLASANTDLVMANGVIVTGIAYVNGGTTAGTMEVKNGTTNVIGNTTTSGTTDGTVIYAEKLHDAYTTVAAGATMRLSRTNGDAADFAIVTVIRA